MARRLLPALVLALVLAADPAVAATAPGLPAPGEHKYDLTGSSNLGPVPREMRLTVGDAGGAAQKWTLDATNSDGSGVIEQLTLARHADGLYLSAYHLQASSSLLGVDLTFIPSTAVLLLPDGARSWTFDMISTDGCVKTHTTAVAAAAGAAGARQLHMVAGASPTGKADCAPIDAKRTQDFSFPGNTYLPTRMDTDLSGHMAGAPASARYRATLRKDR
jgi:hypothetical protein